MRRDIFKDGRRTSYGRPAFDEGYEFRDKTYQPDTRQGRAIEQCDGGTVMSDSFREDAGNDPDYFVCKRDLQ